MYLTKDYLSIWEIAHRWHNVDPNISDPLRLPLPVQDALRILTKALVLDELHVLSEYGREYWNSWDIPEFEEFIPMNEENKDEELYDFTQIKLKHHYAAVEDLDKCYRNRIYDKEKLESVFLDKYEVFQFCLNSDTPPPEFWYSKSEKQQLSHDQSENKPLTEKKMRPNQMDRELCRSIAQTLWFLFPKLNIKEICQHQAIKVYGNGNLYGEKTIRKWITDLDPRPTEEKTGRPKKTSPKQE